MKIKSLMKKGSCCLLVGGVLLCAIPSEAAVTGHHDAAMYDGRLDRYPTIRVYNVSGQEDVPYVSAEEYLTWLFNGELAFSMDGPRMTVTRNKHSVVLDTKAQTISCKDWDAFFAPSGEQALPNGSLTPEEFNAIAVSKIHTSTETPGKGFSIDLNRCGLYMEKNDGKILVPFALIQNVFAIPWTEDQYSYNGSNFYNLEKKWHDFSTYFAIYGEVINPQIRMNSYADSYYSGEFSKRKEISPAYAKYAYGTTCLLFDMYYGHKAEKGIESFDSYLEENGLKGKLLSTDAKVVSQAFQDLVCKLFDSAHDSVNLSNSVFDGGRHIKTGRILKAYGGLNQMVEALQKITYKVADMGVDFMAGSTGTKSQYETACRELNLNPIVLDYIFRDESGEPFDEWLKKSQYLIRIRNTKENPVQDSKQKDEIIFGDESQVWLDTKKHIDSLKPKDFPTSKVDFVDDTAFIYFEHFINAIPTDQFYYRTPAEWLYDSNSFGLFYDAFEKIQRKPEIKKVVIDLSNNGGGMLTTLIGCLGFLSPDGEVNYTYKHLLNQNYCSEWYHVDTNLDGKFDDRDGFGKKYKFYILTSGFSYSCGNALPFFAQINGWAKIIGAEPGGGDCVVTDFLDAYGHVARMSGYMKIGHLVNDQFVSDENAVKVDYPFGAQADKLYYNYKGIAQWLRDK